MGSRGGPWLSLLSGLSLSVHPQFAHLFVLSVLYCVKECWVCTHESRCLQKPAKGVRFPGAGVAGSCELTEPTLGLQEQCVLRH